MIKNLVYSVCIFCLLSCARFDELKINNPVYTYAEVIDPSYKEEKNLFETIVAMYPYERWLLVNFTDHEGKIHELKYEGKFDFLKKGDKIPFVYDSLESGKSNVLMTWKHYLPETSDNLATEAKVDKIRHSWRSYNGYKTYWIELSFFEGLEMHQVNIVENYPAKKFNLKKGSTLKIKYSKSQDGKIHLVIQD